MLELSKNVFDEDNNPAFLGNFGERRFGRDKEILDMDQAHRIDAWETCIQKGMAAKEDLRQELSKAANQHVCVFHRFELQKS